MGRGAYSAEPAGESSPFGCPDCGGVLWENREDGDPRYRCRIGHAYSARALLAAQEHGVEDALWAGLRALEEQESLARRMLDRPWTRDSAMRRRLRERARLSHERAETLRRFLAGAASGSVRSDDSPELVVAEAEAAAARGA
jgi:two-component system chemotaxis response regulator CheB